MNEQNRGEDEKKSLGEEWVWCAWACLTSVGITAIWVYFPRERDVLIERIFDLLENFKRLSLPA